jgi:hypothetical protein
MESDIKTLLKARDMKKPISILFSVSDNYSQHIAMVLTSFLVNNTSLSILRNGRHAILFVA